ncbi:MAG: hypothetical protein M3376_04930 [Actinomycetota bacterium]|nr:hypothetical protein [Actinomycetota bacterium]
MEILLVLIVLAAIAAAAFFYMRSRNDANGMSDRSDRGPALRGPRRTRAAARQDPMADAVERHAMATDPHEAADAELRLQAQANRVASDLHAQQASALESHAGGFGGRGAAPADAYGQPAYDAAGRPVYQDGQPVYQDQQPVYQDGQPVYQDQQPGYQDGQPAYQDGQPVYEDGNQPAYHDEQGRPVYPDDRPRY